MEQTPSAEINWSKKKFPITVIAENIHSPTNIGMIARSCEAFGVSKIYLTGAFANTDTAKFRKTSRAASKYIDIEALEDTAALIQEFRAQNIPIVAVEICDNSIPVHQFSHNIHEELVIIVGSERYGISQSTLELSDHAVHIELYGNTGSLNVAMALSIALYSIVS